MTPRDEWLALRRQGIGSSDISAILGLSEFRSPLHVYMSKVMNWQSPETPYKRIGQLIEPTIATLFEETTNLKVQALPEGSLYRSKKDPLLMCTPDRLIENEPAGLELKNVDRSKAGAWGPSRSDRIPMDAFCQIHWDMATLDYPHYYVGALIGGNDFRFFRFERDEELIGWLTEAAHKFWRDHIEKQIPPQASPEATSDYLKARYPRNVEALLPATDDALYYAEVYRVATARVAECVEALTTTQNTIKSLIGEHDGIEGIATWKTNKDSKVVDWQAVAQALHPPIDLIRKHTTTKPGARVFRFKFKGEE